MPGYKREEMRGAADSELSEREKILCVCVVMDGVGPWAKCGQGETVTHPL